MQRESIPQGPSGPVPPVSSSLDSERIFDRVPRKASWRDSWSAKATFLPAGLKLKVENLPPPAKGDLRGTIKGFSRAAQRRMLLFLASIDWNKSPSHFVGITYHWRGGGDPPGNGPRHGRLSTVAGESSATERTSAGSPTELDWRRWKAELASLVKRLKRRYPGRLLGGVWKEEFQDRGAVHFHLALFWREGGEPGVYELSAYLRQAWNEIAEPGDPEHLRWGSSVQEVRNRTGQELARLMGYLVKYLGKTVPADVETGRIWGHWGQLPTETLAEIRLTWKEYVALTRRIRSWGRRSRYLSGITANMTGFLVLGDSVLLVPFFDMGGGSRIGP